MAPLPPLKRRNLKYQLLAYLVILPGVFLLGAATVGGIAYIYFFLPSQNESDVLRQKVSKVQGDLASAETARDDALKAGEDSSRRTAELESTTQAVRESENAAKRDLAKVKEELSASQKALDTANKEKTAAETARGEADKRAREVLYKLAVTSGSLELGDPSSDALNQIDRELGAKNSALPTADHIVLALAKAKILLRRADELIGQGKSEDEVKEILESAFRSANAAVELAKKDQSKRVSLALYYKGLSLEHLKRYNEALAAYEEGEACASDQKERNRCITGAGRIILATPSNEKSNPKPGAGAILPNQSYSELAITIIAIQGNATTDERTKQEAAAKLKRIDALIIKAGDKPGAGLFRARAHLLVQLERYDAAVEAVLKGLAAQKYDGDQSEVQLLLEELVKAERGRSRTPWEEKVKKLEQEISTIQQKLLVVSEDAEKQSKELKTVRDQLTQARTELITTREAYASTQKKLESTQQELATALRRLGTDVAPLSSRGLLVMDVPARATLFINGKQQPSVDAGTREYLTPRLDSNQGQEYDLRVEVVKNGKSLSVSRRVTVHAGREVRISLIPGADEDAVKKPVESSLNSRALIVAEVPAEERLFIDEAVHPITDRSLREFITPPLQGSEQPGRVYSYMLSVKNGDNGTPARVTRRVSFKAGETVRISLTDLDAVR